MPSGSSTSGPSCGRRPALARRPAPVVHAEHEVGAEDAIDGVELVADAEQHRRGHVAAGGLAAGEQPGRPELGLGVLEQPRRDRDAVVGTGRVRVLGRLAGSRPTRPRPVGLGSVATLPRSHHLGCAGDHAAAVEVQIHRTRGAVGRGDATPHAGDLAVVDVRRDVKFLCVALALQLGPLESVFGRSSAAPEQLGEQPRNPTLHASRASGPHRLDLVGPQCIG